MVNIHETRSYICNIVQDPSASTMGCFAKYKMIKRALSRLKKKKQCKSDGQGAGC